MTLQQKTVSGKQTVVFGYKDLLSKVIFLISGFLLLIGVNVILFLGQLLGTRIWYVIVFVLFLGWVFWRVQRIWKGLYYVFYDGNIEIILPSGKHFYIQSKNIQKCEYFPHGYSNIIMRGIFVLPRSNTFFFTTSHKHLLKIYLKDGRVIYLSPKYVPQIKKLLQFD